MSALNKITDSQITLAIAKELNFCCCDPEGPLPPNLDSDWICGRCDKSVAEDDWFNDISAAMGLLEKYDEVDLWKDADGWNAQIVCNETGGFYSVDKSLPRAITLACAKEMGIEVNEEG